MNHSKNVSRQQRCKKWKVLIMLIISDISKPRLRKATEKQHVKRNKMPVVLEVEGNQQVRGWDVRKIKLYGLHQQSSEAETAERKRQLLNVKSFMLYDDMHIVFIGTVFNGDCHFVVEWATHMKSETEKELYFNTDYTSHSTNIGKQFARQDRHYCTELTDMKIKHKHNSRYSATLSASEIVQKWIAYYTLFRHTETSNVSPHVAVNKSWCYTIV